MSILTNLHPLILFVFGACLMVTAPNAPRAHAGHDDEPAPAVGQTSAPRAAAQSDDFELVALVAANHVLTLYLDRFQTNEPMVKSAIEVSENGGTAVTAEEQPDGTYRVAAAWTDQPGKHDLVFTVTAGELSDLLTASFEVPPLAQPAASGAAAKGRLQQTIADQKSTLTPILTFLLGVSVALALLVRGRRRVALGGVAMVTALLLSGVAFAESGAVAPLPTVTEAPRRLADGSVFVPKSAQRLLAIRTLPAAETMAARTVQIIGRIVPDPSASGRVQASQPGRVEPSAGGLAFVGKTVAKGDVLAELAPAIGTVERGTVGSQIADIDQQVRLAEQKVARLSGLAGSVPGKEIDEARAELEGARRRRTAVAPTLAGREMLRAPIAGVVSVANALVGQIVDSKDVVFEIVDPSHLWVEALAFDPALAVQMQQASAITSEGVPLTITLVGRGLALRQGAIPLEFRIDNPPAGLNVGAPVTVIAEIRGQRSGVALPRAAFVRMPNGGSAVWDHVSAERFVPRSVRVEPLDGTKSLVLAGVAAGQRIVTIGADLLSQVR